MRFRHCIPLLCVMAILGAFTIPSMDALADKKKMKVVVLELGERQIMPARNFTSVQVDNPGVVRAVLNKKLGRLTLIPKRRVITILRFTMKLPRLPEKIKGKFKLVVK